MLNSQRKSTLLHNLRESCAGMKFFFIEQLNFQSLSDIKNEGKLSFHYSYVYIISQYDSDFWSKFLAMVWVSITLIISLIIFMIAFSTNLNPFIRSILFLSLLFHLFILIIVIHMAGSVNSEARRTYKLLASHKLRSLRIKMNFRTRFIYGIKVTNSHR